MPFTAEQIVEIQNTTLDHYIDKGKVWAQNVQNKPMLNAFNQRAGSFPGGKEFISFAVKAGQGGGTLQGYSGDDQVSYYNPVTTKRARFKWYEHHIGTVVTMTELKQNGVEVNENGTDQSTSDSDGREQFALANLIDEKNETVGEDYAKSLDTLIHGDGTSDAKALAGIRAFILDDPSSGSTGAISRTANTWWRNRAATTAANSASSGYAPITSSTTGGGALIQFMQEEERRRMKFANSGSSIRRFCGSDFISAVEKELRANGQYTQNGWQGNQDGAMGSVSFAGVNLEYDPTLDDLSLSKRCYAIDMGRAGLRLLYFNGKRMKRHNPARPYDRYVMYQGITTTAALIAKQLNTSGVYDIA